MSVRNKRSPARGYGITPWSRAFVTVVESDADHRHVTNARRYFRDRHVHDLAITSGRVTASVRGTQLDPFDVVLTMRTVDAPTVINLLRATGNAEDLLSVARGEQPRGLGDLVAPTEAADVASSCTCPDTAPRCIHVLATTCEVAALIDRRPTVLLQVMGTDLPELLAIAGGDQPTTDNHGTADSPVTPEDFYADGVTLPPPPAVPEVDALTELDPALLRAALRASGVAGTDLTEAFDDLATFYAELVRRR